MDKNRFKLIAFIGLMVILLCCLLFKTGLIEKDLFTRTYSAINNASLQSVNISLEGRDVTLNGIVKSKKLKEQAGLLAANVWGVRSVKNNLIVKIAEEKQTGDIKKEKIKKTLKDFSVANIEFETGKSILKPQSYHILNELSDILKEYPDVNILIGGHTDSSGNENFNLRLSRKRAESVKSYLVKKGINTNRLTAKGFGNSKPVADNSTAEGRKKNRRVEFNLMEAK